MNLELWKKIKKEKKMTIEQIAKAANLPKGSVQNIFCGYVPNPRTDTVEAIECALGINEKSPIMERPLSDLAENFIQKYAKSKNGKDISLHIYRDQRGIKKAVKKTWIYGIGAYPAAYIRHAPGRSGYLAQNQAVFTRTRDG